jgi:predicted RNase H-like nuclease
MKVFGLDGCRGGWVAVWIDNDDHGIAFLPSIADLLNYPHALALVDIPIGLPDSRLRRCDVEARALLGKDCGRVFPGIRRGLLAFENSDHPTANLWAKSSGKGISIQLFNLIPKIAEVDRFVDAQKQVSLRETHPELIFWRLNGRQRLSSKKTTEGIRVRQRLIREQGVPEINDWLDRSPIRKHAKPDDILDACAAAVAAREPKDRLPASETQVDQRGLKMEMWY